MNNYSKFLKKIQELHKEVLNGKISVREYEEIGYKEVMKMMGEDLRILLREMDDRIREDEEIGKRYIIQRKLKKKLVSIYDTIEYERTEFYDKVGKSRVKLLDEKIGIREYERFTDNVKMKLLENATNYSYRTSGMMINPFDKITKGTVMNKVREAEVDIDIRVREVKKKVKYLYIDCDEDHMHLQKRDRKRTKKGDFIGKLIYLYEGYEKECNGRYRLINRFTISGLYEKSRENKDLWGEVYEYIVNNYDIGNIKKIYINGDGANWIKEGENIIPKSEFVLDEFHLNKYINKIVNAINKNKVGIAYKDIYRTIELDQKQSFIDLIEDMKEEATNKETIEESKDYILNNWEAIIRRILDNNTIGCSAESHVGHILSKRMSRNPMGWSKQSADKICHMRALQENYGKEAFKMIVEKTKQKDNNYYIEAKETRFKNTVKDKIEKPIKKYNDWLYAEIPSKIQQEILAYKTKIL